jgi:hypothetical protein
MRRAGQSTDEKSATDEAAEWLEDYLKSVGGYAAIARIKAAGAAAGHNHDAPKRARRKLGYPHKSAGFPRHTYLAPVQ